MLAALAEDWVDGAFASRDRARHFVDFDGNPRRYDDLLAKAPADAVSRIAPQVLRQRHANVQAAIARLRDDIAGARLDALIVIGDDQRLEEKFTNLLAFYREKLNAGGWNNYSQISLKYKDQVVCTKK